MASIEPLNAGLQAGDRSSPWPHSSDDPTATKTVRARYAAEAYRRFRALKGAIRTAIVDREVFGDITPGPGTKTPRPITFHDDYTAYPIGPPSDPDRFPDFDTCVDAITDPPDTTREDAAEICGSWQQRIEGERAMNAYQGINIQPPTRGAFDFPSDERKIEAFMEWLDEQVDRGILESHLARREVTAASQWQNVYLRSAYEKGVTHADAALVDANVIPPTQTVDAVFRVPQHADAAGMIYTRAYRELDGVTSAMGQQISRTLAEGISQGQNPRRMATAINDRVDKVGLHRARLIARTETIRAHNESSLNRYADVRDRIEGVTALVEFTTAGDGRVCPECASLDGMVVEVDSGRGEIPVHPNCRCAWLPVPAGTAL